jgi:predicted AAA+ superfamily ATPase
MTGSSPRKLYRKHANLLGGRARRFTMEPLTFLETSGFDIESVMISGLLPPHFLAEDPLGDLRAYVGDYLREEVANEARVQNMPSFAEFLRVASVTSGELLNYTNVARESGVKAKTVREYFQILEDTLLGFRLQPWKKSKTRRMIETEKFYLFDVGVANFISRRTPKIGTPEFGKSFEHYILMELKAYKAYCNPDMDISYWRTASGYEVDFVLGEMEAVIEVKAGRVHDGDLRHIRALKEDYKVKKSIAVSFEALERRTADGIEILPWQMFIERLWDGDII